MSLVKPQLRNIYQTQIKKNLAGMLVFSTIVALLFKKFVKDKRDQRYRDFYKTYDAEKQLQIMNEAGLMQSYIVEE